MADPLRSGALFKVKNLDSLRSPIPKIIDRGRLVPIQRAVKTSDMEVRELVNSAPPLIKPTAMRATPVLHSSNLSHDTVAQAQIRRNFDELCLASPIPKILKNTLIRPTVPHNPVAGGAMLGNRRTLGAENAKPIPTIDERPVPAQAKKLASKSPPVSPRKPSNVLVTMPPPPSSQSPSPQNIESSRDEATRSIISQEPGANSSVAVSSAATPASRIPLIPSPGSKLADKVVSKTSTLLRASGLTTSKEPAQLKEPLVPDGDQTLVQQPKPTKITSKQGKEETIKQTLPEEGKEDESSRLAKSTPTISSKTLGSRKRIAPTQTAPIVRKSPRLTGHRRDSPGPNGMLGTKLELSETSEDGRLSPSAPDIMDYKEELRNKNENSSLASCTAFTSFSDEDQSGSRETKHEAKGGKLLKSKEYDRTPMHTEGSEINGIPKAATVPSRSSRVVDKPSEHSETTQEVDQGSKLISISETLKSKGKQTAKRTQTANSTMKRTAQKSAGERSSFSADKRHLESPTLSKKRPRPKPDSSPMEQVAVNNKASATDQKNLKAGKVEPVTPHVKKEADDAWKGSVPLSALSDVRRSQRGRLVTKNLEWWRGERIAIRGNDTCFVFGSPDATTTKQSSRSSIGRGTGARGGDSAMTQKGQKRRRKSSEDEAEAKPKIKAKKAAKTAKTTKVTKGKSDKTKVTKATSRDTKNVKAPQGKKMEKWTTSQLRSLRRAQLQLDANAPLFWEKVADVVGGGKTAGECHDKWFEQLKSPPVKPPKRKKAGGGKAKSQSQSSANEGEQETREGADEVEHNGNIDDDSLETLTTPKLKFAKRGTLKNKQQVRRFVEERGVVDDDIFESTPYRKQKDTLEIEDLQSPITIHTPRSKLKEKKDNEPTPLLKEITREQRDKLDGYIEDVKGRTKAAKNKVLGYSASRESNSASLPQKANQKKAIPKHRIMAYADSKVHRVQGLITPGGSSKIVHKRVVGNSDGDETDDSEFHHEVEYDLTETDEE